MPPTITPQATAELARHHAMSLRADINLELSIAEQTQKRSFNLFRRTLDVHPEVIMHLVKAILDEHYSGDSRVRWIEVAESTHNHERGFDIRISTPYVMF